MILQSATGTEVPLPLAVFTSTLPVPLGTRSQCQGPGVRNFEFSCPGFPQARVACPTLSVSLSPVPSSLALKDTTGKVLKYASEFYTLFV